MTGRVGRVGTRGDRVRFTRLPLRDLACWSACSRDLRGRGIKSSGRVETDLPTRGRVNDLLNSCFFGEEGIRSCGRFPAREAGRRPSEGSESTRVSCYIQFGPSSTREQTLSGIGRYRQRVRRSLSSRSLLAARYQRMTLVTSSTGKKAHGSAPYSGAQCWRSWLESATLHWRSCPAVR